MAFDNSYTTTDNEYWQNTAYGDKELDGKRYRYTKDTVDNQSKTGADGNSYTTAISNDKLSNDDFLRLMLEEMKMQDPTKPMDSAKLMDSQLQMSTIETNQAMALSMEALTKTYGTSSITNAMGLMGRNIESTKVDDVDEKNNVVTSYKVETVESINGKVYVNAKEMTGYEHKISILGEENEDGNTPYIALQYDTNGNIKDEEGNGTKVNVKIMENGKFELNASGRVNLYDEDDKIIEDAATLEKFRIAPAHIVYADKATSVALDSITKVF